ncbi:MAG: membrane protein insertase YidC [Chitinivibrionales bacterium]|nr:membrane protein insertase YidC [Chitinivibrionales bacterium]
MQETDVELFSSLWFWMRWLCYGLLFILDFLMKIVPVPGVAVMLLSPTVKILMYPLTRLALIWQQDVERKKSLITPLIQQIKAQWRGQEQHERILAMYKEQGIHPLYSLKSLLSAAIQIPIFFAAYHMLQENVALRGVGFLWIDDLSRPDALFRLPLAMPYFGSTFNLLPFIMSIISIVTSLLHRSHSLSLSLHRRQQLNLYGLAALFFILFYPFPAGMVLYWTMNNVVALLLAVYSRIQWKKSAAVRESV